MSLPTLNLKRDGATVLEAPPGMLGAFNDAWFRYIQDIGPAGPDKGKGGKYLVLPPDYEGEIPEGYFVVQTKDIQRLGFHARLDRQGSGGGSKEREREPADLPTVRKKTIPPQWSSSAVPVSFIQHDTRQQLHFYEHLNEWIQEEHLDMLDPETRGLFASIGIEKGKPFQP